MVLVPSYVVLASFHDLPVPLLDPIVGSDDCLSVSAFSA